MQRRKLWYLASIIEKHTEECLQKEREDKLERDQDPGRPETNEKARAKTAEMKKNYDSIVEEDSEKKECEQVK